ncbi:hypothetical protein RND71_028373 [Anisodus tanguticus]|uniref:Aminotransferase-like plant mobile domain-containing protein n=1 Tax=Anisodus tanguticus TaxID=243964 RepID=A0AAE1VA01_9SOLA|nr:hypothetical protein RND71_028373 [Anisodus tanguticus]
MSGFCRLIGMASAVGDITGCTGRRREASITWWWNETLVGHKAYISPRRTDHKFWKHIRRHPLHPRILDYFGRCGFMGVVEVGFIPYDWGIITTLIERWCLETHEAAITLHDIELMFGMVVDGDPLFQANARNINLQRWRQLIHDLTGWAPAEDCFDGVSRVKVWAWERLISMQPSLHRRAQYPPEAHMALARKWTHHRVSEDETRDVLAICTDVLDNLT